MILISGIEIEHYKAIKHAKLDNCKDLNVLIGPNNCGKTCILNLIQKLSEVSDSEYICEECENFRRTVRPATYGYAMPLSSNEKYLENRVKTIFSFNEIEMDRLLPDVLTRQRMNLSQARHLRNDLCSVSRNGRLDSEHVSILDCPAIRQELKKVVLFCTEERLQSYRGATFVDYLRAKKFSGSQFAKLRKFLSEKVDQKIYDFRYEDIIRVVENREITSAIMEQGSGVRSLICIAADILYSDAKIVLIDEPELGLNPFCKQEFLSFLLEESKTRQIFVATHDPTFLNPILWKDYGVTVFFYSPVKEEFVRIDLSENREDPETFAGYLPHTTALRETHIYVEGSSDVYVFSVFLRKYLKRNHRNWAELLNRIGLYHLAGDFWEHLLYTIPKPPYQCAVILDGNNRERAKDVIEEYDRCSINTSKFQFAREIEDVERILLKREKHPVYCLKEDCIEKYLGQTECKPPNWNKKLDGPKTAEEMEIPDEIGSLFNAILKIPTLKQ